MDSVSNTKWVLTEWPNQSMPKTEKKAFLNFNEQNMVSGTSFCNVFGGKAIINGEQIKFEELIGTMMYCDDVGDAEGKFTEGLRNVTSYKINDGKLSLSKDGKTIMIFTKIK